MIVADEREGDYHGRGVGIRDPTDDIWKTAFRSSGKNHWS